ncbi:MAG: hypothetical protein WA030_00385 [Candidatus Microsaccharimonas sp.]
MSHNGQPENEDPAIVPLESESGNERIEDIARLSVTVDGFLAQLNPEETDWNGSKSQDIVIHEIRKLPKDASEEIKKAERFAGAFLQTEDALDGAVGLEKRTGKDGKVSYVVSRPGYNYSVLEYRWTSDSDTVLKGYTEGFAFSEGGTYAGQERPRSQTFQEPQALDTKETKQFLRTVEALQMTHMERPKQPDVFLDQSKSIARRIFSRNKKAA